MVMSKTADRFLTHLNDLAAYADDVFSDAAPDVALAWHEAVDPIIDHIGKANVGRGLYTRLIEIEAEPDEVDMDEDRTATRLEIRSRLVPNVTLHLTSEHYDGMPRLRIWTTVRRGVALLDEAWDAMPISEAVIKFIGHHNTLAAGASI
ncbi:MAG: hypothetical protein ACRC67_22680 [Inquilinus sp.]|uniref:hypothetical protein n=1 Tax=Inquilinus sp. TaxID=1932117 RepID=UPI003F3C96C2